MVDRDGFRWDCFVAYASPDRAIAETVARHLPGRVFRDAQDIPPGAPWPLTLQDALATSRILVALCSVHAREAWYFRDEVAAGITAARAAAAVRPRLPGPASILPVRLDATELPYGLAALNAVPMEKAGSAARALLSAQDPLLSPPSATTLRGPLELAFPTRRDRGELGAALRQRWPDAPFPSGGADPFGALLVAAEQGLCSVSSEPLDLGAVLVVAVGLRPHATVWAPFRREP